VSTAANLVIADCDTLYKLAVRYSPFLRFHEKERFFPILAESWLRMTTAAPWAADAEAAQKDLGDHPLDPHSRGAALFVPGQSPLDPAVVAAGPPVSGDRALQFSADTSDPYAIGRSSLTTATARTFLDVGGWLDPATRRSGDVEYLAAMYSELAGAINENVPWTPMDAFDNVPHSWCPQTPNPTTYCEVTWAGSQQQLAEQMDLSDLAPGDRILDEWVAFTYHYLYAAREPSGLDDSTRHLEGQWESVTLFFSGGPMPDRNKTVQNMVATVPGWIILSEGYDRSLGRHLTDLRAWNHPDVEHNGDHPVIYVGLGTHRQFWSPQGGTVWDPTANPPTGSDPGVHDDDDTSPGFGPFLEAALVLLWLAAVAFSVIPPPWNLFVAAVFLVFALMLFLLWLASLIADELNQGSGDPLGPFGGSDNTSDGGPQGGSDEEPAQPATPPGDPGATGGQFGLPNTGSPTGGSGVSFDVRLIDNLPPLPRSREPVPGPRYTSYPSDRRCEHPYWWDYSGLWGVAVVGGLSGDWESGGRRVDEVGRDWAYWASVALALELHSL
jgi:hypothetical protein